MTEALRLAVGRYADVHADAEGFVTTPIAGIGMMRAHAPTGLLRAVYKPLLCLVLQGRKRITAGGETREFSAGQSLIVNVDIPVIGQVIVASRSQPYLALAMELDMAVMREVIEEIAAVPPPPPKAEREPALFIEDTDEVVLDCAMRLVRLLDRPEAAQVLRASIVKEMHYWLLAGRHGAAIRRLAPSDSHAQRIARAVAVLRAAFAQPLPTERLAAAAGMSPSSFHQHFKAITSISPLQFQKQLRLLEARRLMVNTDVPATRAAFEVGYESVSQFTREYARMFGAPPRRDINDRRDAA